MNVVGVSNTFNGISGDIIDVKEKSKNILASPPIKLDEPLNTVSPLAESTP